MKEGLPIKNREYKTQAYWEERFKDEESYEWLTAFTDIKPLLDEREILLKPNGTSPKVLVVGCGNSDFSQDLFATGVQDICNIDFSEEVITKMQAKQPLMQWINHGYDINDRI